MVACSVLRLAFRIKAVQAHVVRFVEKESSKNSQSSANSVEFGRGILTEGAQISGLQRWS